MVFICKLQILFLYLLKLNIMTIQIYLDETDDYLSSLQIIHSILEMKNADLVESSKPHFPTIRVSTRPYKNSITVNITLEEFFLLLIFVGHKF